MNRTEKKITKRYLFVLLVILLAVMTACGGEDDTVGTEAATPFPTEPTPEPAEESTVVEEPTPTIAPTPTVAPSPTPEPTEEPAGDGWGTSGGTAQSACDHPYFPMRVGSTWTYSDGTNTLIWEVTDIQGDLNQASASLQATINSVTIDYAWDCDASQGMASFDFASLGVAPAGVEMTIESQSLEGVFLLPADQLQPGANWPLTLVGTFSFNQTAGGTQIEATGDLTSEQVYTVTGVEPVTFDEQMVDGLQVEQTNTVTMNINILGTSTNQVLNIGGSYEFGRGIGMIRQVFTSDFGPESFELVSYQVP